MFVECCASISTCFIVSSMFFTMGNQEFPRGFFPDSFKERVTKTGIFQLLSKMHKMLLLKEMMRSLDAPAPSLLLSQTSSDKLCGVSDWLSYAHTSQTADSEMNIQNIQ